MGSTDNSAIMTIDLKWNRFRIHKSTLNKMGNPQYVQFLVNPEEMFIAVLGSDRPLAGGTSNRVKLVQTSRHYSIALWLVTGKKRSPLLEGRSDGESSCVIQEPARRPAAYIPVRSGLIRILLPDDSSYLGRFSGHPPP